MLIIWLARVEHVIYLIVGTNPNHAYDPTQEKSVQ